MFKQKEKTWSFNENETVSAMDIFQKAKAIRIRSSHNKFLAAADDEETVFQKKKGINQKRSVDRRTGSRFGSCHPS